VIAAVMTFYAVRMAIKPPDEEHNYGHGKFESLTSLTEVILLFVTAAWIFYEGIERIFFKQIIPEITIFSIIVMTTSIVIDFGSLAHFLKFLINMEAKPWRLMLFILE
jgi:divalent metal cation (Fe/Co/Zn/Cd) transporter